jgi:putative addiction module component (TIGR02574 family)
MLRAMEQLFDDMTPAQRIRHVQKLWDKIADDPNSVPVTDAMRAELERRLSDHRAKPGKAISWAAVKAKARRQR